MKIHQHFFWKGMVVMMLMMLCLELMTQARAAKQRKSKGRGGGGRRQGRGRVRVPSWLKEVTGRRNKAVALAFDNVQDQNDHTIATLQREITLMTKLSEYSVVQNCSTLFGSPVNYAADAVTGQSDVIARLKAFLHLFRKAKTHCVARRINITDHLRKVTDGLDDYVTVLTPVCDRHASPQRSCGEEGGRYRCQPELCQGNNDSRNEDALVLSYQLQCFLQRLRSSRPLRCTGKGPQRPRKNKPKKPKKPKKPRSRKALKAAVKAFLSQRHLPAWEPVCQQGKITLILHADMTSQAQKAGDSSQAQKKPGGKKEANLARLCQGGVGSRITNDEVLNALRAIENIRVTR